MEIDIKNNLHKLTHPRLLTRNIIYNLFGQASPILVAFFTIPFLIKGLGIDRFGILTLVWMVIGYYSIFDLGLSRALTKLVAQQLGKGEEKYIPELVWTGLGLMFLIGIAASLLLYLITPLLVVKVLKIPSGLIIETNRSFYLLSFCLPIVIITAGLRGVLEAQQQFGLTNSVRVLLGLFNYLGPLIGLIFSRSIFTSVFILMIGRLGACIAYLLLCFYAMPTLLLKIKFKYRLVRQLLGFGSWMSVSNIISPLLISIDRFLIGAFISLAAVAYYTTPYEMVTKLLIIPGAVMGVIFPAFSTSFEENQHYVERLFFQALKYIFIIIFPLAIIMITFSHEVLNLWLGNLFAQNSTYVLQLLTCGIFLNCISLVPFALIQGAGRPDITAKIHLIELPFYLFMIWASIRIAGIEGAAIAFLIRTLIDMLILFIFTWKLLSISSFIKYRIILNIGIALLLFYFSFIITAFFTKGIFLLIVLPGFAIVSWKVILSSDDRLFIKRLLNTLSLRTKEQIEKL